jgi:hypothetical protein
MNVAGQQIAPQAPPKQITYPDVAIDAQPRRRGIWCW